MESRFIKDVTVFDGTLIPPSTPFTKIWRMRNNGTIQWPYGTRLVWVGGDKFANRDSVLLEVLPQLLHDLSLLTTLFFIIMKLQLSPLMQIPGDGFPVNNELDIAIDLVSPPTPGKYLSYWRLASPSGQRFGQQVWVLIQVYINNTGYLAWNLSCPLFSS